MRILIFGFILLIFSACDRPKTPVIAASPNGVQKEYAHLLAKPKPLEKKEQEESKLVKKIQNPKTQDQPKKKPTVLVKPSVNNTTDTLKFVYAKTKLKLNKEARQTNTFFINTDTANRLAIELISTDTAANIQVNQIIGPDGSKIGPFGKKTEYVLPAKGNYKILVSENPKVNKVYKGEYEISMKLKW